MATPLRLTGRCLPKGFCRRPLHCRENFYGDERRTVSSSPLLLSSVPPSSADCELRRDPQRPEFRWLDLRDSGLSMIERLSIEEALLRHDNQNWIIVGTHHVWPPKYLKIQNTKDGDDDVAITRKLSVQNFPEYLMSSENHNDSNQERIDQVTMNTECMVVMGIGGKPDSLLHRENIQDDKTMVVKRFSGGGTVVLDRNSIWTTIIGRTDQKLDAHKKNGLNQARVVDVEPYPRSIMEWTAKNVFGPTFDNMTSRTNEVLVARKKEKKQSVSFSSSSTARSTSAPKTKIMKTLVLGNKGCCGIDHSSKNSFLTITKTTEGSDGDEGEDDAEGRQEIPKFLLRENDYILGDDLKMGGNAQSISKDGWLHHTSFLWDFDVRNMERYLKLPEKRPDYRANRSHGEFLTKLAPIFAGHPDDDDHAPFFDGMYDACRTSFDLKEVSWDDVHNEIIEKKLGGMGAWFEKNRTRII